MESIKVYHYWSRNNPERSWIYKEWPNKDPWENERVADLPETFCRDFWVKTRKPIYWMKMVSRYTYSDFMKLYGPCDKTN